MLLDAFDYRRFTPEECALLEYGARALAAVAGHPESTIQTGVDPFDAMEVEEQLVALHILCRRAASDEVPPGRELWLDATLMAVLTWLKTEVEMAFDIQPGARNGSAREAREQLSRLVVDSYLTYHWQPEEVFDASLPAECFELDRALLRIVRHESKTGEASQSVLQAILEEYQTSWFYDLDFQRADAMEMEPEAYREHLAILGITEQYYQESAPSCPPQAVREAREFLSL